MHLTQVYELTELPVIRLLIDVNLLPICGISIVISLYDRLSCMPKNCQEVAALHIQLVKIYKIVMTIILFAYLDGPCFLALEK